ncbi:MAG TPA: hypothetical protein VGF18_03495, partial [Candidatus Tumulicola sp.]
MSGVVPALPASAAAPTGDDQNSAMALMLFGKQTCAQRAAAAQADDYAAQGYPQTAQATPQPPVASAPATVQTEHSSAPTVQPMTPTVQPKSQFSLPAGYQIAQSAYPDAVAQATPEPSPSPETTEAPGVPGPATPGPVNTPGLPGMQQGVGNGTFQLRATPKPSPGVSPPPVPTPTPAESPSADTIFLTRGGNTPPPITPAGHATPTPSPAPTGLATLAPNYVAVIADKVSGGAAKGEPGDADGNVHIFYRDEEIVGDHAHFDGVRTVTITGHPFLINHTHDSVLNADEIDFDTIAETAKLKGGNGETAEGVQVGYLHFKADDLHTNNDGTAEGLNP